MLRQARSLCVRSLTLCGLLSACSSDAPQKPAARPNAAADDPEPQGPAAGPGDPRLPGVARVDEALEAKLRKRLGQRAKGYKPRTHHLQADGSPTYVNRLIGQSSPYLLQHAHNPVNFFPWGPEAFERARTEGKPILLSVGYSTCHWCHVMERESFEDEEIAAYMNAHYVSIKVDREERPDVDDIYMSAVNMLAGRGGWPMTVMLTPDLRPFFGGTYFPPRDGVRGARKGFLTILTEMHQAYTQDRERVLARAEQLSRKMKEAAAPRPPGAVPDAGVLIGTAQNLARGYDASMGGFGRAPKFPQPSRITFLLRYHRRTGDPVARQMAIHTLKQMAAGGMYDQVGGGFHRYSTDGRWLVPHFEKMLYDNAQLAVAYLEGYQLSGDPELARVATETLDYVVKEMTAPGGGFYSATDADSDTPSGHQEEGYFFTWTPDELKEVLDEAQLKVVMAYYAVTRAGNFEGRNILHTPRPMEQVASELGLSAVELAQILSAARKRLYGVRALRPAPGRDDKILSAWNGLMIGAFARGALVLDRPDYAGVAGKAADFILTKLRDERGRLLRSHMDGESRHNAYLDDHAFMIEALLNLHEATGDVQRLEQALKLQSLQDAHFLDGNNGGYFATSDDHEVLLTRDKSSYDGAVPSGNSVAMSNLLRLSELTADMTLRQRAEQGFAAFSNELHRGAAPRMLAALDYYLDVPLEVVLVRGADADGAAALLGVVRSTFLPNRVLIPIDNAQVQALAERMPLLNGKLAIDGKTTAFVCEQGRCELPTSNPRILKKQLSRVQPLLPNAKPPALATR